MKNTLLFLVVLFFTHELVAQNCVTITRDESSPNALSYFGHGALIADVNNDGIDDLLVTHETNFQGNNDIIYVTIGPLEITETTAINTFSDFTLSVPQILGFAFNNQKNISTLDVYDFNNDGIDDLFVGQPGGASIFFGPLTASIPPSISFTISNPVENGFFRTVGDITGNGFADLIYTHSQDPTTTQNAGKIYIFEGPQTNATLNTTNAFATFTGEGPFDEFGDTIQMIPDMNDDGLPELYVSASEFGDCIKINPVTGICIEYIFREGGKGYIFNSPIQSGDFAASTANKIYSGENPTNLMLNRFGYAAAYGNDYNGDGEKDLIISARGLNTVYAFYGPLADGTFNTANATKISTSVTDFGSSLAGINDLNNDNNDELFVVARGYNDFSGRAYLFEGPIENSGISAGDVLTEGDNTFLFLGNRTFVGDLNNDGTQDIALTTQSLNSAPEGVLQICYLTKMLDINDINTSVTNLQIVPNPAKNELIFQTNLNITSLVIFDVNGKKVVDKTLTNNNKVAIAALKNGLYIVEFTTSNNNTLKRKLLINN